MNRKQCLNVVRAINDTTAIKGLLNDCINESPESLEKRGTWQYYAEKMLSYLESDLSGIPPFSIFAEKGNKKLPFAAFSSLALADCPGKGDCVNFCYSLRAWRYPAAFFRQLQNSLLMRLNTEVIEKAFLSLKTGRTVRLFVDGDFKDVETLKMFMDLCHLRPDLKVYGYSKSWLEFVKLDSTGYTWPPNYLTNASSGSRHERTGLANAFLGLPVVRGDFLAVKVDKAHIQKRAYQDKTKAGSKEYRRDVLAKLRQIKTKAFACPGNCGNCLPQGRHACGSRDFAGVAIGIGIH
jgi:hypothetical protein